MCRSEANSQRQCIILLIHYLFQLYLVYQIYFDYKRKKKKKPSHASRVTFWPVIERTCSGELRKFLEEP